MADKIGFIGLGIMGGGMARNLLKAGFEVHVWNRTPGRMEEFAAAGARKASDPADLASRCPIVMMCVSNTPDVQAVIFGPRGVMEGAKPGLLVIDLSTISPQATRDIAAKLEERGMHMIDAPVSGGSEGAAQGTLTLMVGGKEKDVERAMPFFKAIGKRITHVGDHGAGQMVKLVNQILVVGNAMAMSEALLFAQAGGLDLQKTLNAVSAGAAGSWMLTNRGPQILQRDWRPGFTIDLQQKDVRLVLAEADGLGVPALLSSMVFHLYRTLQAAGLGSDGNHALIKALERLSGLVVGEKSS